MIGEATGLRILSTHVSKAWVDYNGHMGDFAYGIVFSDAATAYMDRIGIDAAYRSATEATLYTLDSRIGFLRGGIVRLSRGGSAVPAVDRDRVLDRVTTRETSPAGRRGEPSGRMGKSGTREAPSNP